jgi:hypothetical protein
VRSRNTRLRFSGVGNDLGGGDENGDDDEDEDDDDDEVCDEEVDGRSKSTLTASTNDMRSLSFVSGVVVVIALING